MLPQAWSRLQRPAQLLQAAHVDRLLKEALQRGWGLGEVQKTATKRAMCDRALCTQLHTRALMLAALPVAGLF